MRALKHTLCQLSLSALLLTAAGTPAAAAPEFATKGTKATLSVEYVYLFAGKTADKYDSKEWKIRRILNLSAEMAAAGPTALPTQQAPDAQQMTRIEQQKTQAEKLSGQMAPMARSVEAIVARCGENEKCIEREIAAMGNALAGSQQHAETTRLGRETASVMQPGALRYQAWKPTVLRGTYDIDEWVHVIDADPICMSHRNARCQRTETRKGNGVVPGASADSGRVRHAEGFAVLEFDGQSNSLFVRLPVPLNHLPIIETITTDKPRSSEPQGPRQRLVPFEGVNEVAPFVVALKQGWRAQAGEQAWPIGGSAAGNQLKVRWRFTVQ